MSGGKHIVITGASSGMGAALARALAADGHAVYACARRMDKLRELAAQQPGIVAQRCDVSREEDVRAFVAWVRTRTARVDALVQCAGSFGAIGPAVETDSRQWLDTLHANLFGAYLMAKHVVPRMAGESRPCIVNFSGGGAFSPFPRYSAYAVSKTALVRLTEILAVELAQRGIAVNAVAPGFVATEIHEATLRSGRALAGEEFFAETQRLLEQGAVPIETPISCVKFLLSDQAAGLTGKTISASFDPWGTPEFVELIPQINASDLYTLRRINLVNLPDTERDRALSCSLRDAKDPVRGGMSR